MEPAELESLSSSSLADAVALLARYAPRLWGDDRFPEDLLARIYEQLVARADSTDEVVAATRSLLAANDAEDRWLGGLLSAAASLRCVRAGRALDAALLEVARPICRPSGDGAAHGRELLAALTLEQAKRALRLGADEVGQALPYFTLAPEDTALVQYVASRGSSRDVAGILDGGELPSATWTAVLEALASAEGPESDGADMARGARTVALAREKGDRVTPEELFAGYGRQVLCGAALLQGLPRHVRDASGAAWVAWLTRKVAPARVAPADGEIDHYDFTLFLELGLRIAPRAFELAAAELVKKPAVFAGFEYARPSADLLRALVALRPDPKMFAVAKKYGSRRAFPEIIRDYDPRAPSDASLIGAYVLGAQAKSTVPFTALSTQATPDARGFQPCERSRVGGPGPALAERPTGPDERPMVHVATLFAGEVPGLAVPKGIAAVALYISDPLTHAADEPGSEHVAVRMLDASAVTGLAAASERDLPAQRLLAATLNVPAKLDPDDWADATAELDGFAGGAPAWVQDGIKGKKYGAFLFQGNDNLLPLNLGDDGTLYAFEKTAFFQCS